MCCWVYAETRVWAFHRRLAVNSVLYFCCLHPTNFKLFSLVLRSSTFAYLIAPATNSGETLESLAFWLENDSLNFLSSFSILMHMYSLTYIHEFCSFFFAFYFRVKSHFTLTRFYFCSFCIFFLYTFHILFTFFIFIFYFTVFTFFLCFRA